MSSIASVQQHLLDLQHTLAEASRGGVLPASPLPEGLPPGPADSFAAALRASGKWAEYQHVIDTIRRFGGHKTKAAESLGMTPRALRYRLNAMREQGVQIPV